MIETTIGITMGDPTGIGPELVLRLVYLEGLEGLEGPEGLKGLPRLRLYGDAGVLARTAAALSLPLPGASDAELVPVTALAAEDAVPGRPGLASGAAQVAYLEAAIADARAGRIQGLCTAPLHKASARAAGLAFPGHTELLAERLGAGQVVMMLCGPSLRVALCTTHLPLSEVPRALSRAGITAVLRTTVLALVSDFGIAAPRVLVAGLNPHAGEQGHFGSEEQTLIRPAIAAALALPELAAIAGLSLRGPEVPDVVFRQAVHPDRGPRADAVVAMYHDQGLIPLKLIDFEEGVNVTLGLPIVRTAPDHGVAHDIAGSGRARLTSMAAALRLCCELVRRRQNRVV